MRKVLISDCSMYAFPVQDTTSQCTLNPCDSDLSLDLNWDNSQAHTFSKDGFGYCFGGVRGCLGVVRGRWCFHVRFLDAKALNVMETPHLRTTFIARVGVSQLGTPLNRLGEAPSTAKEGTEVSIGLNSTGSHVCDSVFTPFNPPWPKFQPKHTLTVLVDLSNPAEGRISYAMDGVMLGSLPQTISINLPSTPGDDNADGDASGPHGSDKNTQQQQQRLESVALFPHLLLRNCGLEVDVKSELLPRLQPGPDDPGGQYRPWAEAAQFIGSQSCWSPCTTVPPAHDCEVVMMVGLPGSGKTTWAREHMSGHPDKRYMLLSPEQVLDSMRVSGLKSSAVRRRLIEAGHGKGQHAGSEHEHHIEQYYGLANSVFEATLNRAAFRPRNYIIDQTNVSEAGRTYKLQHFRSSGYNLTAVLAAPYLAYLNMLQETAQSEGAPHIPEPVILKLMAEFQAPKVGGPEGFTRVLLVHEPRTRKRNPDDPDPTLEQKVSKISRLVVAPQRSLAQQRLEESMRQQQEPGDSAMSGGSKTGPPAPATTSDGAGSGSMVQPQLARAMEEVIRGSGMSAEQGMDILKRMLAQPDVAKQVLEMLRK